MHKPRIFIAMHYMEIGGAEISLIGLLNALDTERCDVDLFVYSHRGELMQLIPDKVHLLPQIKEYANIESPMTACLKSGCWRIMLGRLKAKHKFQQYASRNHPKDGSAIFQMIADEVTPVLPSLDYLGCYDMAISFLTPHNIVLEKVKAKKKLAWIHTDYTNIDVDAGRELKVWGRYDHIASISEQVTKAFLQIFPSLADKIVLIENILSPKFVRERSKAFAYSYPRHDRAVNLLSVGRYSHQKNFDNVPDICRRIHEAGINACWYLVGYGDEEALIRQKIAEARMDGHVIILGKQSNPYPYMAACDIYVQPSRYEGKSVTVREAQMLCKPVVVTDYATAASQVKHGKDGVIVPLDNAGCAAGITALINDKPLQEHIVEYLECHDYGNEGEVNKIYKLLD